MFLFRCEFAVSAPFWASNKLARTKSVVEASPLKEIDNISSV